MGHLVAVVVGIVLIITAVSVAFMVIAVNLAMMMHALQGGKGVCFSMVRSNVVVGPLGDGLSQAHKGFFYEPFPVYMEAGSASVSGNVTGS